MVLQCQVLSFILNIRLLSNFESRCQFLCLWDPFGYNDYHSRRRQLRSEGVSFVICSSSWLLFSSWSQKRWFSFIVIIAVSIHPSELFDSPSKDFMIWCVIQSRMFWIHTKGSSQKIKWSWLMIMRLYYLFACYKQRNREYLHHHYYGHHDLWRHIPIVCNEKWN